MRLGLFDGPEGDPWGRLGPADVATPEHGHLAADAACQGLVLLVNKNGTLPLGGGVGTVAVIGPHIEAGVALQVWSIDVPVSDRQAQGLRKQS
jgi:beta-glucosidase-like glycosyl hydrolase